MVEVEVRETKPYHVSLISKRIREGHKAEVLRFGANPRHDLFKTFCQSTFCDSWFANGRLMAISGVVGTLSSSCGWMWLALDEKAMQYPREILTNCRRKIASVLTTFESLETVILMNDKASARLIEHLGFVKMAEHNGIGFYKIWRK